MSTSAAAALSPDPWTTSARAAIADLAANALGIKCTFPDIAIMPDGVVGSMVPIVSNDLPPLHIGLFSSDDGCAVIARALLGFSPSEALSRGDVVDAVNEIVNMLSGSVKARVPGYATHAALGLPTFVHGPLESSTGQSFASVAVSLNGAEAYVLVIRASR